MGKQSARMYFRGKDHKEIYYQGHYHDAMYIGSTLVWEKLKAEQPSGTPLDGFSAICYYNGFYYVVNYDSSKYILYLYQGKSLQSLKQVYTVKSWYQTSHNLYIADQYGLILIRHGDSGGMASVHFDYLDSKQINVANVIQNNLQRPINVTVGDSSKRYEISFVYGRYLWYAEALAGTTVYAALHGDKDYYFKADGMNVHPSEDAFVYNDRIILPLIEYKKEEKRPPSTHGVEEGMFIYFLTKGFEDAELELTNVQIPSYVFYNRAAADLLLDKPDYTPEYDKTKFTYMQLSYGNNRVENGYFIADSLEVRVTLGGFYTYNEKTYIFSSEIYTYRFELVINLRDLSFEAVKFKDENDTLRYDILHSSRTVDKIVMEKYAVMVYQERVNSVYVSYLRYSSYPDYDEIIPFSEISDKYDVLKNVSGNSSSKFEFLSSYKMGSKIYCSVKKLENYLLQIDTANNTASVIKPQLYLEEETL